MSARPPSLLPDSVLQDVAALRDGASRDARVAEPGCAGAVHGETSPVSFSILGVERVHGRGRLVGIAIVEFDIGGVVLTLQGVQITREPNGSLDCAAPMFRNPRDGQWVPALLFPPELIAPLAQELISTFSRLP